jgi:hypothetical protein
MWDGQSKVVSHRNKPLRSVAENCAVNSPVVNSTVVKNRYERGR